MATFVQSDSPPSAPMPAALRRCALRSSARGKSPRSTCGSCPPTLGSCWPASATCRRRWPDTPPRGSRRRRRSMTRPRMLREARPDVVHVLTPPHTHAALVSRRADCRWHTSSSRSRSRRPTRSSGSFGSSADGAQAGGSSKTTTTASTSRSWRSRSWSERGELGEVREVDVRMALPDPQGRRALCRRQPAPPQPQPAGRRDPRIHHAPVLPGAAVPAGG